MAIIQRYNLGAISGGFDPFHNGHLDHLLKAAALCHLLMVFISSDEDMKRKKGFVCLPLGLRRAIVEAVIRHYRLRAIVIDSHDKDGTQCETLKCCKPDVYIKGGDRTPENMLQCEKDVCAQEGIEIIYGVGDLLNSSTKIAKEGGD